MRIREWLGDLWDRLWPFIHYREHGKTCDQYRRNAADLRSKLDLAAAERMQLEEELSRLRVHFDDTCAAKDEAYSWMMIERDNLNRIGQVLVSRLNSLGLGEPDWAAFADPFLPAVIIADFNGVRAKVDL